MVEQSKWVEITERDPNHSTWYVERFRSMVAAGEDLEGEARFVDAVAPRRYVLTNLGDQLRGDGRIVIGFGAGRGYDFEEFRADADKVGLVRELELASWDLRPLTEGSDFLVAVLGS